MRALVFNLSLCSPNLRCFAQSIDICSDDCEFVQRRSRDVPDCEMSTSTIIICKN